MRFGLACQCVPVRGRDSLVPVHPDRGSVSGFDGFTLANVSFGIPWLACCCLPLEDCGCVVRSGLVPLITLLANPCQPGGLTLASFPSFPQRSGQLLYYFVNDTPRSIPLFTKCPSSFQGLQWYAPSCAPLLSLILPCSLDNNNSY